MNLRGLFGTRVGLYGLGVIVFGVIAIASLWNVTYGGDHPLALESEVDLCEILGDDAWLKLEYPASDAIVRVPEHTMQDAAVCALELDPVPPDDRWGRVARGDDADRVRRIATVMLTTTAMLRRQSPDARTENYTATFDAELIASGWAGGRSEGPWSTGFLYTLGEGQVSALIEDDGVVMWLTATGVSRENMEFFALAVVEDIRQYGDGGNL